MVAAGRPDESPPSPISESGVCDPPDPRYVDPVEVSI